MAASAPRACVQLGSNATAELVEDFGPSVGGGATFTNSVLEVQPQAAEHATTALDDNDFTLYKGASHPARLLTSCA
jgi:hypothetical protein